MERAEACEALAQEVAYSGLRNFDRFPMFYDENGGPDDALGLRASGLIGDVDSQRMGAEEKAEFEKLLERYPRLRESTVDFEVVDRGSPTSRESAYISVSFPDGQSARQAILESVDAGFDTQVIDRYLSGPASDFDEDGRMTRSEYDALGDQVGEFSPAFREGIEFFRRYRDRRSREFRERVDLLD